MIVVSVTSGFKESWFESCLVRFFSSTFGALTGNTFLKMDVVRYRHCWLFS